MRLLTFTALLFGLGLNAFATETPARIELPVLNVLIPGHGFDDNDHVQAVVYGELPHACMTLGETVVEKTDSHTLTVRQFAWLKTTGVCAGGDVGFQPVPYDTEVSFGRLPAGTYAIRYHADPGPHVRNFKVTAAETDVIDDYNYAQVTGVSAPGLVASDEPATLLVRGVVDTSCARISDRVSIEKQGDVFVVLPIETRRVNVECEKTLERFSRKLRLGVLKPGQYLVHIRAKNGKAVNKLFTVLYMDPRRDLQYAGRKH